MTLLTCAAAVTSRVRLGTSVLLFALRNPVLMAKTTATLDYLSGGRLILGVSLGGRDNEFEPLGVSMQQRVSRLRENLAAVSLKLAACDQFLLDQTFAPDTVSGARYNEAGLALLDHG